MQVFEAVVWGSLVVSWALFVGMFIGLDHLGIYAADFFNVGTHATILNVEVIGASKLAGCSVFFFLNAFTRRWNGVVVDPVFGQMVYGSESGISRSDTGISPTRLFPVMAVYEAWRSSAQFFTLLGMLSNLIFFISTVSGSLLGALLTRWMYIHPHYRHYIRKAAPSSACDHSRTLLPLRRPFEPLRRGCT